MSDGQKRLNPRMTRGRNRLQLLVVAVLTVNPIYQLASRANEPWDGFHTFSVAFLLLCGAVFAYLLYVRHRDGNFWDEEEARRADLDRRGRQQP